MCITFYIKRLLQPNKEHLYKDASWIDTINVVFGSVLPVIQDIINQAFYKLDIFVRQGNPCIGKSFDDLNTQRILFLIQV